MKQNAKWRLVGCGPRQIQRILGLMKLQYEFARAGRGWDEYAAARAQIIARLGSAPNTFPGTPTHPYWQFIRRLYFYDPGPTLRQLQSLYSRYSASWTTIS
ncbi:MAG TPA: hypothetical protein VKV15_23095 [Bryobacteraceae bacterium]|nr:hypothetical protein [Bryobacteraceae bacterium]